LAEHIDYITPGVKLSAKLRKRSPITAPAVRRMQDESIPHDSHGPPGADHLPPELRNCGGNITTECIRALYGIPAPKVADQANAPGFFEQGDWYNQRDLNSFFTYLAPWIPNSTEPI